MSCIISFYKHDLFQLYIEPAQYLLKLGNVRSWRDMRVQCKEKGVWGLFEEKCFSSLLSKTPEGASLLNKIEVSSWSGISSHYHSMGWVIELPKINGI